LAKGGNVSFTMGVTAQVTDLTGFVSGCEGPGKTTALEFGATDFRVNQIVMGGDRAGLIAIIFEVPSVAAAMEVSAGINANSETVSIMKDSGYQMVSRSLMRNVATRGNTDGQYGSMLLMSGGQVTDEEADSNLGDGWNHMSGAANGMRLVQSFAAGATPTPWALIGWTDDLDAYVAASAQSMADPKVQQNFADGNIAVHGRIITKRLV